MGKKIKKACLIVLCITGAVTAVGTLAQGAGSVLQGYISYSTINTNTTNFPPKVKATSEPTPQTYSQGDTNKHVNQWDILSSKNRNNDLSNPSNVSTVSISKITALKNDNLDVQFPVKYFCRIFQGEQVFDCQLELVSKEKRISGGFSLIIGGIPTVTTTVLGTINRDYQLSLEEIDIKENYLQNARYIPKKIKVNLSQKFPVSGRWEELTQISKKESGKILLLDKITN